MSTYVPGFWSQQYQNLSNDRRTQINKKVDEAFRQQTGISRCLDPKTDRGFVNQWLRIRDEVMAEQSKQGATSTRKTGFGKFVKIPSGKRNELGVMLYNYDVNVSHMKPEHQRFLDGAIIPFINQKFQVMKVLVIGSASRTGSEGDDQSLSEARAAIVQSYLRHRANPSVFFQNSVGLGKQGLSKQQLFKDSPSDEDERDRSVIVMMVFEPPSPLPPITKTIYSAAQWADLFERAYNIYAHIWYSDQIFKNLKDYVPNMNYKPGGIQIIPIDGTLPNSWTDGRPTPPEVDAALRKGAIDLVKDAVRKGGVNIPDAEIEQRFDTWFKSQQHK
jgi:outer membrane protein OmpA-like peptidoglycan-associated protein